MPENQTSTSSRKWLPFWVMGGVSLLVLTAVLGIFALQNVGPVGAVPTRQPMEVINQQAAALEQNAADHYLQALRLLNLPNNANERFGDALRFGEPVPPEVKAWIKESDAALAEFVRGSEITVCVLPFDMSVPDMTSRQPHHELRMLAKLTVVRARVAAETGDLTSAASDLGTVWRAGSHLGQQPPVIMRLIGVAFTALATAEFLPPLERADLPLSARAAFARALLPHQWSAADPNATLQFDRDCILFAYQRQFQNTPIWRRNPLMAPQRVAGAIDAGYTPRATYARAPLRNRLNNNSPAWIAAHTYYKGPATWWDVLDPTPLLASILEPSITRMFELEARSALETRGTRLALILFIYHAERGEWPASLEALLEPGVAELLGVEIEPNDIVDAFVGEPFVYRLTDDGGMLLYSRGYDKDDDGGVHDGGFGEPRSGARKPDGDYVFWPPSARESLEAEANEADDAEMTAEDPRSD